MIDNLRLDEIIRYLPRLMEGTHIGLIPFTQRFQNFTRSFKIFVQIIALRPRKRRYHTAIRPERNKLDGDHEAKKSDQRGRAGLKGAKNDK